MYIYIYIYIYIYTTINLDMCTLSTVNSFISALGNVVCWVSWKAQHQHFRIAIDIGISIGIHIVFYSIMIALRGKNMV